MRQKLGWPQNFASITNFAPCQRRHSFIKALILVPNLMDSNLENDRLDLGVIIIQLLATESLI